MSNKDFMPHANAAIGVVTFEPSEDDPLTVNTMIHHVVGWVVNEHQPPVPVVPAIPPKWFSGKRYYTIFLPEGVVIDPVGAGTSLPLEEAIRHFQGELLAKEKEKNPPKKYNH